MALLALCLGCASAHRPEDATRVAREVQVRDPARPEVDRWFATVRSLQALLGADGRLRDEALGALCAILSLSPDAEPEALGHAIQTRAAAEGVTLTLADDEALAGLDRDVDAWTRALTAGDPDPADTERLLRTEARERARVRCVPAGHPWCDALASALDAERWRSVVRERVAAALGATSVREAIAARGVRLGAGATGAMALEFRAAARVLAGVEARAAAMRLGSAQRVRWVRSVTVAPTVPGE